MKKAIFTIYISVLLFNNILFGQNTGDLQLPFPDSDYVQILGMTSTDFRNLSNNKTNDKVDGSPYLFEHWINLAKVFYNDREYDFQSFNYNIYAERFEVKIAEDSVFVINSLNVKKVIVNNKVFKHYMDSESQKNVYFEEIIDFDDYRILRKHSVKINSGTINPLTREKLSNDRLVKNETFYIFDLMDQSLKIIQLKKSNIQPLIKKEKLDNINKYIIENRLKYKDIDDLKKIIKYYNTL